MAHGTLARYHVTSNSSTLFATKSAHMKNLVVAIVLLVGSALGLATSGGNTVPGRWLDDRGAVADTASLDGTTVILTMAYGACRRTCSAALRTMKALQFEADRRGRSIQFVVVGLDPTQDRPADWAAWRRDQRLERPNWHFLSGSEANTRRLAERLHVRYWRYGEHTLHDYRIVMLAPDGRPLRSLDRPDQDASALFD